MRVGEVLEALLESGMVNHAVTKDAVEASPLSILTEVYIRESLHLGLRNFCCDLLLCERAGRECLH